MTSKLELQHEGRIIVVLAEVVVVGRRSDCELRVIHPLVSRQHCRFELRPSGVTLVDLGGTNGTYINGERLSGSVGLRANDCIRIGTQGPRFLLLRAEVNDEEVTGWDPEAMQETMVATRSPPSSDVRARVSVGPQARAAPDDDEDTVNPAEAGRVAPPSHADTGSQTNRSNPLDDETGRFPAPGQHAPVARHPAQPSGSAPRSPRSPARPRPPPAAQPPIARPAPSAPPGQVHAAVPAGATPIATPATLARPAAMAVPASTRPRRRRGHLAAGFALGALLAVAGVAALAVFAPLPEKLYELVPGLQFFELPQEWR